MSWITIVGKDIWHVTELAAGVDANPTVAAAVGSIPIAGSIINMIFSTVRQVETMLPVGNGALKKTVVTQAVTSAHPAVDAAKLSDVIDKVVAALNALEGAFKAIQ